MRTAIQALGRLLGLSTGTIVKIEKNRAIGTASRSATPLSFPGSAWECPARQAPPAEPMPSFPRQISR
jgi:hypothetical protein